MLVGGGGGGGLSNRKISIRRIRVLITGISVCLEGGDYLHSFVGQIPFLFFRIESEVNSCHDVRRHMLINLTLSCTCSWTPNRFYFYFLLFLQYLAP